MYQSILEQLQYGFSVTFSASGNMTMIGVGFYKKDKDFDVYSSAAQDHLLHTYNDFLQDQFGVPPPYRFKWGEVEASRDIKSGQAEISIFYKRWIEDVVKPAVKRNDILRKRSQ
jgi:hypothetical protein